MKGLWAYKIVYPKKAAEYVAGKNSRVTVKSYQEKIINLTCRRGEGQVPEVA